MSIEDWGNTREAELAITVGYPEVMRGRLYSGYRFGFRGLAVIAASVLVVLAGCSAPPPQPEAAKPDATTQAWYGEATVRLAGLNRQAEALLKAGQRDETAAAISQGLPLQAKLLEPPRPTLQAMEAVSDLDDLYARMLLANRHDGDARMLYQKNVARWRLWRPRTAESERRLKQAQDGLAACDRRLR